MDVEYESYKERGTYKKRFVGYKFRHMLKVEFLSDNDRLGKVLYALANCSVKLEFRLSYTVSDPVGGEERTVGKGGYRREGEGRRSDGGWVPYSTDCGRRCKLRYGYRTG